MYEVLPGGAVGADTAPEVLQVIQGRWQHGPQLKSMPAALRPVGSHNKCLAGCLQVRILRPGLCGLQLLRAVPRRCDTGQAERGWRMHRLRKAQRQAVHRHMPYVLCNYGPCKVLRVLGEVLPIDDVQDVNICGLLQARLRQSLRVMSEWS